MKKTTHNINMTWGTTVLERAMSFPADSLILDPDAMLYRGVFIEASSAHVYRWLCQLRVAPYSYDWIDNLGRQSPQRLLSGLENLVIGQDVMGIFRLVDYQENRHLTLRIKPQTVAYKSFGDIAGTYLIASLKPDACRLIVKLIVRYPPGVIGLFMKHFLPWGDFIMMRRQLLNLKRLAEDTARSEKADL